ncbi:MAG: hypothetical protein WCM76_03545 [Bacteroidota bacterium]
MRQLQLSFNGPFPFKDLEVGSLQKKTDKPGVYIWGFEHPLNKKFIPYFVGAAGLSVRSHLARHFKTIFNASANTYKWLSEDYLFGLNEVLPFYADEKFPDFNDSLLFAGTQHLPLWYHAHRSYFDDKFIYLNNFEFLRKTDAGLRMTADYPFSILGQDVSSLVPYLDRLQFCYGTIVNGLNLKLFYEYMEAFIRFLLKGKTMGNSLNFGDVRYLQKNVFPGVFIRNSNGVQHLFKEDIGLDFSGYEIY